VKAIAAFLVGALPSLAWGSEANDPCTPPNFPLPDFRSAVFNVRDFGATGNGDTNDTSAINRAIDACSMSGGGNLVFPPGTYSAASIHIKSNVRFVLDKNAIITGAASGYDPPEPNEFDKYQDFGHSHFHNALMWGEKIENFAIIGGRVNGGHIIKEDDPRGRDIGDKVISIKSGRHLLFQNVTHETGGHFVYLLNDCEDVTIDKVTIKKSRDGVNLVGCRNVQLHDCNFTGCGDDTLALKSDYALGRKIKSENIYAWNCYFETACNALQFGAETVGDFHNINFWNIRIGRAWKAAIGMTSADGGIIDGVRYRDIDIKNAACPIFLRLTSKLKTGELIKSIGAIRNVTISNVTVSDCQAGEGGWPRTSFISGQPESPLEQIVLDNVKIRYNGGGKKEEAERDVPASNQNSGKALGPLPAAGFYIRHVKNLTLRNVDLEFKAEDARPVVAAFDVTGFGLDGLKWQRSPGEAALRLDKIDNLSVNHSPPLRDRINENVESMTRE